MSSAKIFSMGALRGLFFERIRVAKLIGSDEAFLPTNVLAYMMERLEPTALATHIVACSVSEETFLKIPAIKLLRSLSDLGLAEAKDLIEAALEARYPGYYDRREAERRGEDFIRPPQHYQVTR